MKFTMRTITTSFVFLTFIVICNPIFAQFTEKEFDVDLWANAKLCIISQSGKRYAIDRGEH